MEARLSKPVGGLMGEEVTVTATPDEWRNVINDIIVMEPEGVSPATLKLFDLLDGLGLA